MSLSMSLLRDWVGDRGAVAKNPDATAGTARHDRPATPPLDLNGPVDVSFEVLPADWIDTPIIDLLRRIAARQPASPAIRNRDAVLSYGELLRRVDQLAAAISELPRRSGAVGVLVPNSIDQPVATLATLAAGRSVVPFNPHDPAARTGPLIADAALDGMVVADPAADALPPGLARVDISAAWGDATQGLSPPGETAPAIVLHTSGSTGRPKAIVVSQPSLLLRVMQHVNASHIGPPDRICPLSSPCTISGIREQFAALLTGATLHVVDPHHSRLDEIRRSLVDGRVSIVYGVPALLRAIVSTSDRAADFASLRVVRLGGDTVLWRDIALLRAALPASCHLQIGFSSTESPGTQWFVPPGMSPGAGSVPLGYAMPGLTFDVLADDGASARPDEVGELVIHGRYVALGLWENGVRVPGPFRDRPGFADQRTYATGDLVRLRPDGLFAYAGRKDRQIKIRGQRVDASEVEAALRAVPGVRDAALIAVTEADETSLAAFVETTGDAAAQPAIGQAMRALPTAMRPRWLHPVAAIPRLPSAKPDMAALVALDKTLRSAAPARAGEIVSRGRTVERVVARAWHEALGTRAGLGDPTWTEAGGDSLRMLGFALAVERGLGRDLPLDLFDAELRLPEIVAGIERLRAPPPEGDPALPLVFFFPGIEDDTPHLARFRRSLNGKARFETIDYPDWPVMIGTGGGMDRLVELACARILALPAHCPVRLAGYSFGAVVALALCKRLLAAGRDVAWLAVFDTDVEQFTGSPARPPWTPPNLAAHARRLRASGVLRTVRGAAELAGVGLRPLLRRLSIRRHLPLPGVDRIGLGRLPRAVDLRFRWALRLDLTAAWLRAQPPLPFDIPVSLFRTDDHPAVAASDLGWSQFSRDVAVHRVDGDHMTMFWRREGTDLAEAFARHLLDVANR